MNKPADPPKLLANDPQFKATSDSREDAAGRARKAQRMYKRLTQGFVVASSLAAISGGIVLYGIDSGLAVPEASSQAGSGPGFFAAGAVQWMPKLCQAIAVAVAAYCAYMLTTGTYAQTWRKERRKAEELRHRRGLEALEIGHREGHDGFKAAGDYFYKDLVEGQISYIREAEKVKGRGATSLTVFGAVIMAFGVGAPFLAQIGTPSLVLVGALAAIVTPALLSGLRSWSEATASGDRQKLHQATLDLIRDAAGRKREFDAALERNDLDGARSYANLVIAALKTDLDGFLEIMRGAFQPPEPTLPPSGEKK